MAAYKERKTKWGGGKANKLSFVWYVHLYKIKFFISVSSHLAVR